ncbi:hypothetical protein [Paenibacillus monticola]|uniref:Uncharacterized protein n=1 Tax=Paenibacillus monticola TaxID=2666075 RepID=A0A7X2H300_9BACL|nr:hypothetical protein [Paenibacillus monticola]MRN52617.1 hypothetical protein [Paenibacillus monticola]
MNRHLGSFVVLLMLVGCSGPNTNTAAVDPTPISTQAPTLTPASTPSPTVELSSAYLETGHLGAIFGFADGDGKHLLVTGQDEGKEQEMALLNKAIGNNGQVLTIKFEKWQAGNEQNNGRELALNFINLPGYLFTLEEGSAVPDETYYVVDAADFNLQSLLPIKLAGVNQETATAEDSVRSSMVEAKGREVLHLWKLADVSVEQELFLVQFVKQDDNMLFCLVLKDSNGLVFADYPAVLQDDGNSVWRVDDGGEVTPEMFSLLFAAQTANGLVLGLEWWGAEGVNTFLLHKDGVSFNEMDIQYSRYTSPI